MNTHTSCNKLFLLLFGLLFCLVASKVCAEPAAEEWIDVKVVVNILDGADASNVNDAIAKANEAFAKAKIRLTKTATDPNAKGDTDGDGGLNHDEGDNVLKEGQEVLKKTIGAGKGIKIDIAENCDTNDANTVGWAIHRTPVIVVEPDADVNELGRTIAHELGHALTLDYDLNSPGDINSLMYGYTGGGTGLDVNEVNEIRQGARVRGTPYFIVPRVLPSGGVAVPAGIDYSVNWFGAILDNFNDVLVNDPYHPIPDPNNPNNQYADIGEVIAIEPDGLMTPGTHIDWYIKTTIQLGDLPTGNWNIDSFFDITYQREFGPPIGRAHIVLQNWTPTGPAIWYDASGLPTPAIIDVQVDTESEFRGMPHHAVPHNKTIQVKIPLDIILEPDMPEAIIATVSSQHLDHRYSPDPVIVMLMDQTLPFKVSLSQPCHCPSFSFALNNSPFASDPNGNVNISGCGFAPNICGQLYVESNSRMIAEHPLTTSADGSLTDVIGCSVLNPAEDWVRVSFQPEYYGPPEAAPKGAMGYFKYCPGGEISGDLNSDCAVDLLDFAVFANDWLEGTKP